MLCSNKTTSSIAVVLYRKERGLWGDLVVNTDCGSYEYDTKLASTGRTFEAASSLVLPLMAFWRLLTAVLGAIQ